MSEIILILFAEPIQALLRSLTHNEYIKNNSGHLLTFSNLCSGGRTWKFLAAAVTVVLLVASGNARAQNLLNGNFSSPGTAGQLTVNTTLTNWTGGGKEGTFGSQTTPPVFVFLPGEGQTGVSGDAFMGTVSFYGVTAPPDNGIFVAAAGDPSWVGSISETITGLTIGDTYSLSFNWAGAQQQGFSGSTTEDWQVSLGGSNQSTSTVSTPSQTFTGWQTASLSLTGTATSELLKFTAIGSPSGEEPWLLLDNVKLSVVPEPSTWAMMAAGVTSLFVFKRRRR